MSQSDETAGRAPRFEIGRVQISGAAATALEATATEGVLLLARHLSGDWGDIADRDALQNELAILLGLKLQSRYVLAEGIEIWIITEADRAKTSIICPELMAPREAPGSPTIGPGD